MEKSSEQIEAEIQNIFIKVSKALDRIRELRSTLHPDHDISCNISFSMRPRAKNLQNKGDDL